ncbi:hypothetical protein K1719_045189 [Acacia pycnantha]|nr:hypothetical protein K1719_045189 [Acacia pycnantha]
MTTSAPSIPMVVRPTLSFVSSPQLHELAIPKLPSPGIESAHSFSPGSSPSQVPSPQMPSLGIESLYPLTPRGASGRLSPWGRDPIDGRIWIYPEKQLGKLHQLIIGKCGLKIGRKYKWLPEYEDDVKRIWNAKCSNILRGTMHNIRQDLFHKQLRPKWIPYEVMNELERIWTTPEYLKSVR